MPLFEVLDDGGRFQPGPHGPDAEDLLDEILEQREGGRQRLTRYIASLEALTKKYPDFIDGYAHLGFALLEHGKPNNALGACEKGLAIGEAAIPPKFRGRIEWGWHENRPFLRAAQGIALCYQQLGRRAESLAIMERLLKWNPSDNQGLRYLIGSEYLRAAATPKAKKVISSEAESYPPYRYEAALMEIVDGRFIEAATMLRRAFVANDYIAEMLCGSINPMKLAIWHASNFAEPEVAKDYVDAYGALWQQTPGALHFLRWVHTHPKVMMERAEILEMKEALFWERDTDARRHLLNQAEQLIEAIDDGLSRDIVQKRTDWHGRLVDPWLGVLIE